MQFVTVYRIFPGSSRARLLQASASTLRQLCDDASDTENKNAFQ